MRRDNIQKFFDQIQRGIIYKAAELAGMPKTILGAYRRFAGNLQAHNSINGKLCKAHTRRCGIPQGCPLSMMFVALHMRPWIVKMNMLNREDSNNQTLVKVLADAVILVTTDSKMLDMFATTLNDTHEYLHDTGASVAPSKSFNSTNSKRGKKWLEETTRVHIKEQ